MDIPIHQIRQLPVLYRQSDTLAIAAQVAVISLAPEPQTIFLLDLAQLTSPNGGFLQAE